MLNRETLKTSSSARPPYARYDWCEHDRSQTRTSAERPLSTAKDAARILLAEMPDRHNAPGKASPSQGKFLRETAGTPPPSKVSGKADWQRSTSRPLRLRL